MLFYILKANYRKTRLESHNTFNKPSNMIKRTMYRNATQMIYNTTMTRMMVFTYSVHDKNLYQQSKFRIIIRGMKQATLAVKEKTVQRCSEHLYEYGKVLATSYTPKNFMTNLALSMHRSKELILTQSMWRASTGFSTTKKDWMTAMQETNSYDLSKVKVENPLQKTDVRYLTEARVAANLSKASETILGVTLAYEHPNKKTFDLLVTLGNKSLKVTVERDIKSGNNLYAVRGNKVGEIPIVKTTNEPYGIMNDGYNIKDVFDGRLKMLERDSSIRPPESYYKDFLELRNTLNILKSAIDIDDINKHYLAQEAIFKFIINTGDKTALKFSLFVLDVVEDKSPSNIPFYQAMEKILKEDSFSTTENVQELLGNTAKAYSSTVQDLTDILHANKAFWTSLGMENIIKYVIH